MYKIDQLTEIDLGVVQENEATTIEIDVTPWQKKWPNGIFAINVCRPGEMEAYPAQCTVENGILKWLVKEGELAVAGNGRCDIRLYQGTVKKKTRIAITRIHETLPGSETDAPPDAAPGWLDALNQSAAEAREAAEKAIEAADAINETTVRGYADQAKESAENAAESAAKAKEIADRLDITANGDMKKATYDADGDGVVDDAERLGGELPSAYRKTADPIDFKTEITNKPTMESFQVNFLASGWALDSGEGVYAQTAAADLNPDTDEIVVDINLNNEYKDELREAWAELRNFAIVQGGLTGHFFEQPTVAMTVNVLRYRKA